MSDGSEKLKSAASAADVADALGVARQVASRWRNGTKRPSAAHRRRLHELYGIEVASWGRKAGDVAAAPAAEGPAAVAPVMTAADGLRRSIQELDARIATLGAEEHAEFARLTTAKTVALGRLSRLTHEGDLTLDVIRKSKPWRDLLARLAGLFQKHPELAHLWAEAMKEPDADR
jgi:transcriptional regulator with XRE-family HTH domain